MSLTRNSNPIPKFFHCQLEDLLHLSSILTAFWQNQQRSYEWLPGVKIATKAHELNVQVYCIPAPNVFSRWTEAE